MNRRMVLAVLALLGLLNAVYLALHAYHIVGSLACGSGGCNVVQESKWARFMGLPTAVWGAGYFATVLALALLAVEDRFADAAWVRRGLLVLTGWGVLFSAWLTWLEAFKIDAWCRFCLVSAGITVALFALALLEWRSGTERIAD